MINKTLLLGTLLCFTLGWALYHVEFTPNTQAGVFALLGVFGAWFLSPKQTTSLI